MKLLKIVGSHRMKLAAVAMMLGLLAGVSARSGYAMNIAADVGGAGRVADCYNAISVNLLRALSLDSSFELDHVMARLPNLDLEALKSLPVDEQAAVIKAAVDVSVVDLVNRVKVLSSNMENDPTATAYPTGSASQTLNELNQEFQYFPILADLVSSARRQELTEAREVVQKAVHAQMMQKAREAAAALSQQPADPGAIGWRARFSAFRSLLRGHGPAISGMATLTVEDHRKILAKTISSGILQESTVVACGTPRSPCLP